MKTRFRENGQVLIVIAIAAVALFAFAALAIDGSMVFSDRRQSQNASDTAVLAAALGKVQNETVNHPLYGTVNWSQLALERAADNGYDNNDPVTEVQVEPCTADILIDGYVFECQGLPANARKDQYIHVVIKSEVQMSLAQVLGWQTMTNYTTAVAHATEPEPTEWVDGYAIAALREGCSNPDPFVYGGSSQVDINNSGILVNSNCDPAFHHVGNSLNSHLYTDTGVCVVGEMSGSTTGINPPPTTGCPNSIDLDTYQLPPEPECANAGNVYEQPSGSGNWIAQPGYYNGIFPGNLGGSANITLTKGVYCLNGGVRINAGVKVTTDVNDNGVHDGAFEGVLLFLKSGGLTFNGNPEEVTLHAISQTISSTFDPAWINLLIYVSADNNSDITLSGSGNTQYTGTILAPSSRVKINGNSGSIGLNSQIIADTVSLSGNATINITYNAADNSQTTTSPGISLIR